MNIDDLQCTVTVSSDWRIILDVKNKFNNGWKFIKEEPLENNHVSLVFERIYKIPEHTIFPHEYRKIEEYA